MAHMLAAMADLYRQNQALKDKELRIQLFQQEFDPTNKVEGPNISQRDMGDSSSREF